MKIADRVAVFLDSFQLKHAQSDKRSAVNLLVFQLIYLVLIAATIILSVFVDHGERLWFYLLLLGGLMLVIGVALFFNLRGRFRVSTWLTAFCMVAGPWISILLDPSVAGGDFVPLIYVGMSIQLCSILLRERMTIIIAIIQLAAVVTMILICPALRQINWASLVAFIVFTAVIGVLYGFSNKRQLREIDKQHNQLVLDEAKLRALSVRDPLTGLYNRRYMEETFDREIQRAIRKQQQLSVVMADIDGFKEINDSLGHVRGDQALIKVSALLMKNIRASDVACRYGGDEFCLILPDCTLEEGIRRAEALRRVIEQLGSDAEKTADHVTLSLGVAAMPESGLTRETLLAAADSALYSSKRAGRNRVNGIQ
ncbi:MAG: GGDEF domain-containing protein [Christensenella sp.]|nr:GGDEF domain-containing protein [Christensenella sp.]